MQSPKSKRPHAPGENPSSFGNVEKEKGGIVGSQGPSGKNKGQSGKAGPVFSDSTPVPVHSPNPSQGGGPGYAGKGDQDRRGGKREGRSKWPQEH